MYSASLLTCLSYIQYLVGGLKCLNPSEKYGSVSKPCTPSVHIKIAIKIAGIYGCSFPKKYGIFIGIDPYPYWKPMLGWTNHPIWKSVSWDDYGWLTNHQPTVTDEKPRLAQLLPAQLRCLQERTEALPGSWRQAFFVDEMAKLGEDNSNHFGLWWFMRLVSIVKYGIYLWYSNSYRVYGNYNSRDSSPWSFVHLTLRSSLGPQLVDV